MLLTWAPSVLEAAGLTVRICSGFADRSHGEFPSSISGVWHHDASPVGDSPGALDWMLNNWANASANFWVNRYGVWYCVGAGVAWHAGATLSGMPTNFTSFGVETDQTVNEVPSPVMLDSIRCGFAALLKHMGRDAQSLHFHKTVASPVGRKQDPWFDVGSNNQNNWYEELIRERRTIQGIMEGGSPPSPSPTECKDDGMALIIVSPGKADIVVFGSKAILISDGQSTVNFRNAGIPVVNVSNADFDRFWNELHSDSDA